MQLHSFLEKSLTQETRESVGNIFGTTIKVVNPEDDGAGCEFLRVRFSMNITKSLPCCCKLKCDGKHIGWGLLKFERLPNFCYWRGKVNHIEKIVRCGSQAKTSSEKRTNNSVIGCMLNNSNPSKSLWW